MASRKEVTDITHIGCCENRLLGDMVECRKTTQEAVAVIQVREDSGLDQDAATSTPPPGAAPSLQAAPAPMVSPSAGCEKWEDCWICFERSTRIY